MTTFTGRVYKLVDKNTMEMFYIGSTKQSLAKRLGGHRNMSTRLDQQHLPVYKKINEIGQINVKIILIEELKCENKDQLHRREAELIREHYDELTNKAIPKRSKEEWREDNPDYNKEYRKNNKEKIGDMNKHYRENNKETIAEYKKIYYENNKEAINEYHKQWYEKNKKEQSELKKQKYENNKEAINARRRELYQAKKLAEQAET